MIAVQNVSSTSKKQAPKGYSTWKEWWESRKGRKFSTCSSIGCTNLAEVGAQVKKSEVVDRMWYIVPLCKSCSQISGTEPFHVRYYDLEAILEDY